MQSACRAGLDLKLFLEPKKFGARVVHEKIPKKFFSIE